MQKNNLRIENLKIKLENGQSVIDDASLEFSNGEIVLLEGVNGSGKSTILNALMHHPDYIIESGKILLDNDDITKLESFELARRGFYLSLQHSPEIEGVSTIKMLWNSFKLIKNPESNISITDFKKDLEEKCKSFDLDISLLTRDVNVGFSGGQKKQAELMHMLALEPKIIFMDEPDSGVDMESVQKIFNVINYFRDKGSAILLTSHNEKIKDLKIDKIYRVENRKVIKI